MAVDDVAMCTPKSEAAPESCELRSSRNSAEMESSANSSRASSLLTDITECSSGSSSSSASSTSSSVPHMPPQYQQQQPPLKGKHHLYKSTSSFHLSGYGGRSHGHTLSNGVQACCQLARFPPHPFHPSAANYNPLTTPRHLRQMQTQHHCVPFKMGHLQFGGVPGQIGSGQQVAPAPASQPQSQAAMHSHHYLRHQSSVTSFTSGCQSQLACPSRSASLATVGIVNGGGCACCPCCCCHCEQRFCRRQSQASNIQGSYEGLMGSPSHTVDGMSPPEHGPPPLTVEGLSWRRLHMSRAKLKATATTSELLSGFAMVAMVELQINEPTNVPEWLFVLFAVCTTILVSVHIFALMISTYILPNVDAVSKMQHTGGESNAHFSHNRHPSYSSNNTFSSAGVDPAVLESPHERMRWFIELAWAFSTVLGLFLFLVELAILCWVKFWDHSFTAAWAATVIVIPVLILFLVFAAHFYHSLVAIKCDTSASDIRDLERMKADLDAAARDASAASNV